MGDKINDDRFSHIAQDPRFRRMKKEHRKVKIDKRFEGMFKDAKFKVKYTVDKRGRPIKASSDSHLQRYYELSENESNSKSDNESDGSDEDESHTKKLPEFDEHKTKIDDKEADEEAGEDEDNEDEEVSSEEEESDEERIIRNPDEFDSKVDRARGVGISESSSSDDEDSDENDSADDVDHKWGELADDAIEVEDATYRLAVCNMDWDRIKAKDIMVLLNSFKPANGIIKSVDIYPSEFGKKRMAEEAVKGPQELTAKNSKFSKDQTEEGNEYHREKLRTYQLNRLKYYYAVVICDSKETANAIYEQCDGIEYETSSSRLDLRFIPDDLEMNEESKSKATELPDFTTYKPSLFITTALNQSKVELTWDETDKDRTAVTMRKFTKEDLEALDVKDYLASSGSEDEIDYYAGFEDPDFGKSNQEEVTENTISKYKNILASIQNEKEQKNKDEIEMEVTWEPGLKETTEDLVKKKQDKNTLTPWELYLENKKDKKKKKREEKKSEQKPEINPDAEKTDEISDDEIPNDIDLNDPYFQEELSKSSEVDSKKKKKNKKKESEEDPETKLQEGEMALLTFDKDETKNHFSLKGIQDSEKKSKKKKKRKKKNLNEPVQDNFEMDVSDTRFADVFNNPLFNIDPSAKEYKKTKGTEALITEKLKRKENNNEVKENSLAKKHKTDDDLNINSSLISNKKSDTEMNIDPSLMSLVKSIKAKTSIINKKHSR